MRTKKKTMDLSTESSVDVEDRSTRTGAEIEGPMYRERSRDILLYKNVIRKQYQFSDHTIVQIFRQLVSSDEIGDERVLLGSIAFATVFQTESSSEDLAKAYKEYLILPHPDLHAFGETFRINDLEWFKTLLIHGYLQVDVYSSEIMILAFEVLYKNCLTYTKYSYVAYKILQSWLEKAAQMNFWLRNDTREIESKLESAIFANWNNCINEIARRNATQIFSAYLRIMCHKYDGFLEYIFENCVQNLSWQNVTKYTILVEIFKYSDNISTIASSGLASCIFTSLTKNDLKSAGTLLYSTILKKLRFHNWENIFGEDFIRISTEWEEEKELTAIDLLWEQWMKPTMQKFPSVFEYLWGHPSMKNLGLSRTYLEKIGDQLSFKLIYEDSNIRDILSSRIIDISETTRVNGFAVICRGNNWKIDSDVEDPFVSVKRFLFFNANASTVLMRKGTIENFKMFLVNLIKFAETNSLLIDRIHKFFEWLHGFLLNCFEIGSSYQRKIFGLNLYGMILNFMTDEFIDGVSAKRTTYQATLKSASALRMKMIEQGEWKFVDRRSAFLLLKLATDQMVDVREKSTTIIIRYFRQNVLEAHEIEILAKVAKELCNSSKFHEIAGGSCLLKILSAWKATENNFYALFINIAAVQLDGMKRDILKSASEGSPFFGALSVILELGLAEEINGGRTSEDSLRKLLDLLEDSTSFFLSVLSTNKKDSEFSASFRDMSIAIEETIRNSETYEDDEDYTLSPSHQLVVSCIWMSLKVSCELAAEMGNVNTSREILNRAANLIVSVLLKCRHKGAIEAAGLALGKLTKILCMEMIDEVVKDHLVNLLSIDSKDNINLTRRGAGLTIMFHRIVSSDVRKNRPFLHFSMAQLLDSLKSKTSIRHEDCRRDSTCARHLHFLRSLIADKGLQAHLVRYMEDVCLLCFSYIQSPEWTVRNASLQLFGAVITRLVGQCSSKELDYGIGNTMNYFVTHYPILAENLLYQLKQTTASYDLTKKYSRNDLPNVSNIVPILTLLSKLSTGGCDLLDYSSSDYRIRGKKLFSILLAHPVFHVRGLAAKAYAAFVPFADIRCELTIMKMRKINWYHDNYNHGQLLAQYYLERKYQYEAKCTGKKFVVRRHKIHADKFEIATSVQLSRAGYCWQKNFYSLFGPPNTTYTIHNLSCFTISAMLLRCLIDCPVAMSIEKKLRENRDGLGMEQQRFVSSLFSRLQGNPTLGLYEFLQQVIAFNGQYLSCPSARMFYTNHGENAHHYAIFKENPKNLSKDFQLNHLVTDALNIIQDPSKTQSLLNVLSTILDILKSRKFGKELEEPLILLSDLLKNADLIDGETARPCAEKLQIIGHIIEIETTVTRDNLWESNFCRMFEMLKDEKNDDAAKKKLCIEWLSRLVQKIFDGERNSSFYRKEFVFVVVILLTDEDAETREFTSDKLRILTTNFTPKPSGSICSRANLHVILTGISSAWAKNNMGTDTHREVFRFLLSMAKIKRSEKTVKSPYEEDETSQRDCSEFLNLVFYCSKVVENRILETDDADIVELKQIDAVIMIEKNAFKDILSTNLEHFLEISTCDYLEAKQKFFTNSIQ